MTNANQTKGETMITFKIGPDYTIADDNGQVMEEWIGQDAELFKKAMGRDCDHSETVEYVKGREITYLYWVK